MIVRLEWGLIIIISSSPPLGGARHTGVYASDRADVYVKAAHFFEKMEDGNENGGQQPRGSGTDEAVSSALRSMGASRIGQLRMPWEHGMAAIALGLAPLMGPVGLDPVNRFHPGALMDGPSGALGTEDVVEDVRPQVKVHRLDAAAVVAKRRKIDAVRLPETDIATQEALRSWRAVVAEMGTSSELFNQMLESESDRIAERSFAAAFFGKPASTLAKRAASLRLFIRWAHSVKVDPFPLEEKIVFQYMEDLLYEGAPPTRAQTFKESLNFAHGFVGLQGVRDVLTSRRIQGSALSSLARKSEPKKRSPLTKAELVLLEQFVVRGSDEDPGRDASWRDRCMAGFALFCVYCRLRVGDASRIHSEPKLDVSDLGIGYIECGMIEHKTSFRVKSRVSLPVAGAAIGVSGEKWASIWLRDRALMGRSASNDGCLMLAPGIDGTWTNRRITTTEFTVWLRELIGRLDPRLDAERAATIGSHSLKATLLSWAGKFGLAPAIRRRLGGHVKPKDRSLIEYSRDEMAAPLSELDRVLAAVSMSVFDPDAGRSGRFTRNEAAEAQHEQLFPAVATPKRTESTSSSSDTDTTSSVVSEIRDTESGSDGNAIVVAGVEEFGLRSRRARPTHEILPEFPTDGLVRHRISGMLHANTADGVRMRCGRATPHESHFLLEWPDCPYPLCRICFRQQ